MILGSSARIEEVIQYADFTQKISPVQLVDESTVDDEPNLDDLNGLIDGNITLNSTNLHVLPAGRLRWLHSVIIASVERASNIHQKLILSSIFLQMINMNKNVVCKDLCQNCSVRSIELDLPYDKQLSVCM